MGEVIVAVPPSSFWVVLTFKLGALYIAWEGIACPESIRVFEVPAIVSVGAAIIGVEVSVEEGWYGIVGIEGETCVACVTG